MIKRAHRFHGYNSLRNVYSRGATVRSPFIILKYVRNERRTSYRSAVVVSRKVHHSAVVRNRIRRRIYEVIRMFEMDIVLPYDIVITVFSEQIANTDATILRHVIEGLLKKAGIISTVATPLPRSVSPHAIVSAKEGS